jgi:hypothetical protein
MSVTVSPDRWTTESPGSSTDRPTDAATAMRDSYLIGTTTDTQTSNTNSHRRIHMSTVARLIALPAIAAGILGGAALGLAGMANAGTYSYQPSPRPGIVVGPSVKAQPPAEATPGARWHRDRHRHHIDLSGR